MESESTIYVAVVPSPEVAGELSGRDLFNRFEDRVGELGASLGRIANQLRERLDATLSSDAGSAWRLDEVELSFSLDLEAEAGVVVARAKTAAGFEATLRWSRTARDGSDVSR